MSFVCVTALLVETWWPGKQNAADRMVIFPQRPRPAGWKSTSERKLQRAEMAAACAEFVFWQQQQLFRTQRGMVQLTDDAWWCFVWKMLWVVTSRSCCCCCWCFTFGSLITDRRSSTFGCSTANSWLLNMSALILSRCRRIVHISVREKNWRLSCVWIRFRAVWSRFRYRNMRQRFFLTIASTSICRMLSYKV